ncbi:DUF4271 domain-containing protein [Flavobacterium sp. UBA6135]|uniref:DUF4271 domain-containing protein n=1 Tax=Flavobacterium sp. UBA6135 TaxID=1946553 RepID=UPI0025BC64CD|nr:DUF4271 domain-containing protein [Flavobacterium sp. UBA6135]
MMELLYNFRETASNDWATILFVLCLVLITIIKTFFETRFYEFLRLFFNDKYLKIYKDSTNLLNWFTVSLFIIQLISLTFITQIVLSYFGIVEKTDGIKFIQLFTLFSVFILSKYLIEKIIATSFSIEEFSENFNLYKLNYRGLIGLLALPIAAILFYNEVSSGIFIYILMFIILTINIITYIKTLKAYQSLLISKIFYFILYLCALEIAPYYFIYYWFTKT